MESWFQHFSRLHSTGHPSDTVVFTEGLCNEHAVFVDELRFCLGIK